MEFLLFLLFIVALVFYIWAFIDLLNGDFDPPEEKVVWVLVVLGLNIVGALLYVFIGRNKKITKVEVVKE